MYTIDLTVSSFKIKDFSDLLNCINQKKNCGQNCAFLRKTFIRLANLVQKDPTNYNTIDQYQQIKKSYKDMTKTRATKRDQKINNIQKLTGVTENTKLFLSYLKSLRGAIKLSTPKVFHLKKMG